METTRSRSGKHWFFFLLITQGWKPKPESDNKMKHQGTEIRPKRTKRRGIWLKAQA